MEYKGRMLYIYDNRVALSTKTGYDMLFATIENAKAYIDRQEARKLL